MERKASVLSETDLQKRTGSRYPEQFTKEVKGRSSVALGDPFGVTQFGVNVVTLEPGAWSSHRHWHEREDELVYALSGKMVLVDDVGRHDFLPGMCAGFKANNGNGHHILNESQAPAKFLVIGSRFAEEVAHYSDVDLKAVKMAGQFTFTRKSGATY